MRVKLLLPHVSYGHCTSDTCKYQDSELSEIHRAYRVYISIIEKLDC